MMARPGIAGVASIGLVATASGVGCAWLDAQGREALIAQGQTLFAAKKL
jgi:hypothetical protein